jgi:hypothetical protein
MAQRKRSSSSFSIVIQMHEDENIGTVRNSSQNENVRGDVRERRKASKGLVVIKESRLSYDV